MSFKAKYFGLNIKPLLGHVSVYFEAPITSNNFIVIDNILNNCRSNFLQFYLEFRSSSVRFYKEATNGSSKSLIDLKFIIIRLPRISFDAGWREANEVNIAIFMMIKPFWCFIRVITKMNTCKCRSIIHILISWGIHVSSV